MSAAPALVAVGSRADLEARVADILARIAEATTDEGRKRRQADAVTTLTDLILVGCNDETSAWTAYRAGFHATPTSQAPDALRAAFDAWRGTGGAPDQEDSVSDDHPGISAVLASIELDTLPQGQRQHVARLMGYARHHLVHAEQGYRYTRPLDVVATPEKPCPDVTALVIPLDPEQPVHTVTVEWDQATYDDHTDPSDADVFIGEALRHIDPQKRYQLDSETGPLGTRVWWVPGTYWAHPLPPVNTRAAWLLGDSAAAVRSDLIVTGPGSDTAWPASLPENIAALIQAGA